MTRVELPFDSDFHCPEGTPKSRGLSCANISVLIGNTTRFPVQDIATAFRAQGSERRTREKTGKGEEKNK